MKHRYTFHLIGNAHLDPVWLWDWREGLNEGVITCRKILELMDEDKDFTFIRGEAAIYQHIQKTDPAMFARIRKRVKEGRWEIVGGTVIQPDTNLPNTESLIRQFIHGQSYFKKEFGQRITTGWSADSFGHAAGLPEVLANVGITSYAFTRPHVSELKLDKPAFWWEGPGGSRILAYRPDSGWYASERAHITQRLDELLKESDQYGLHNVALFYGLGNHGGGPTRRLLADLRSWATAHPEVKVLHSGLHRFFESLRREISRNPILPVHRGELNYCMRGCYASLAKFKSAYRKTENHLLRAERTDTVISAALSRKTADINGAWDGMLFNAFHDILPGSSIERAFDDQIAWVGGVKHAAHCAELHSLNALASQIDTRVAKPGGDHPSAVAAVVWNPHGFDYRGPIEIEASLDYRPIWQYSRGNIDNLPVQLLSPAGKPNRLQVVAHEHTSLQDLAWRKRVVAPLHIPAFGWSVMEFGWVENPRLAPPPARPAHACDKSTIDNGIYRVSAKRGDAGVIFTYRGKSLFGATGLSAVIYEDPYGSWGGMLDEHDATHITTVREAFRVKQAQILERGPERASLWVRLEGRNSWLELTFSVCADRDAVDVSARLLWNERSARLKLVMPGADEAEFSVPGASVRRKPAGDMPGGRWVRARAGSSTFGFASDLIYCFDCDGGALSATVVRASRYANDVRTAANEKPWQAGSDLGEHRFKFLIDPGKADLPVRALHLEQPPVVFFAPPHDGRLPRSGSLASIAPASLDLLAITPSSDGKGLIVRVRETTGRPAAVTFTWQGNPIKLGKLGGRRIASWELRLQNGKWVARCASAS